MTVKRNDKQHNATISMTPSDVKILEKVRKRLGELEGGKPSASAIFRRGLILLAEQKGVR